MSTEHSCGEVDDIEDLVSSRDDMPNERYQNKKSVTVRARKKQHTELPNDCDMKSQECDSLSSIIPGTQTIYIKSWGCAHNNSDGEYMAGQLAAYGYKLTEDKDEADLWLLNSCTVKNPSEQHFRNEIEAGKKLGKALVLSGCVPQGAPNTDFIHGLSVIGVQQIDRVVEVVEETLKGHTVKLLGRKKQNGRKTGGASLLLPKVRKNPLIEIIPVNTGCLNQCTYCKTKHARGELGSYPPEEIVARAVTSFDEGVCELWLTSEDTGTYGRDIGTNLPELLWKLVEVIPEGCMMRVGMTNPPYILEHLEEMAKILAHPRVYSFLHIPIQSGSDAILASMKREYSRADFERVADYFLEKIPGMTIATDIICGFPGETDEDFQDTLNLCKKYKFPSLFINQFFPRPGTPAARMERVPPQEVKKRTKILSDFFQSYKPYEHQLGKVFNVLVTELSHDGKYYVGHNKAYEQVLVPKRPELIGKMVTVKIISTSKHSMMGKPISSKVEWPLSSLIPSIARGEVSANGHMRPSDNSSNRTVLFPLALVLLAIIARILWLIF